MAGAIVECRPDRHRRFNRRNGHLRDHPAGYRKSAGDGRDDAADGPVLPWDGIHCLYGRKKLLNKKCRKTIHIDESRF